jgi:hypothetical protein
MAKLRRDRSGSRHCLLAGQWPDLDRPAQCRSRLLPPVGVGQNGFVYVAYLDGGNYLLHKFSSCATGLQPQAGFPLVVTQRIPVFCPFPGHDRCDQNPSSQTVAVDDTNPNHIYYAYAQNKPLVLPLPPPLPPLVIPLPRDDIFVRDSLDGGLTWPPERVVRVSSGVDAARVMPWVCTTGGEAFVSWYDRRAATPCSTPPCPAPNDLTDYFAGSARLDRDGNLTAGAEFKVTEVADPWCASGWPCGTRATSDAESCSVQPQLAGICLDPATGLGSGNRCDFSDTPGVGTPPCLTNEVCALGSGCPKYGDYNGNACAAGRLLTAWASATSPPSIAPPSTTIDIFFASRLVGSVPQVQIPGHVLVADTCVGGTSTATMQVCNTGNAELEIGPITSSHPEFTVTTPLGGGYPVVVEAHFCFPFQVLFTPTSAGARAATLTVPTNDPMNPSVNVSAAGNGIECP